jgi:uncharacterized protein YbbC (DUF1343 family)
MSVVRPGLDIFLDSPTTSGPLGLLTNVASLTQDGRTAWRALRDEGAKVVAIFSPEHGYYAIGAAGEAMPDDDQGGVPVYSLYGTNTQPAPQVLRTLSALLVDLQNTGARWYTLLGTLKNVLAACAKTGTPVIVLDRPNPQGGVVVEGPLVEPEHFSLVAPADMPVRYGLTFGEAARWLNAEISAQLSVVEMAGWSRDMLFADTGLMWSAPSPNMPTALATLLYTGTCLVEGISVSEGRGTPLPFEQIGAPLVRAEPLAGALNELELPGVRFTPAWFRPAFSDSRASCRGVRPHLVRQVRGFAIGLHLVDLLQIPAEVSWVRWMAVMPLRDWPARRPARHSTRPACFRVIEQRCQGQRFQAASAEFWLYE